MNILICMLINQQFENIQKYHVYGQFQDFLQKNFRFSKVSQCSNSVNFEGRRNNLNPFLESLKALLSNAHARGGAPLTQKF